MIPTLSGEYSIEKEKAIPALLFGGSSGGFPGMGEAKAHWWYRGEWGSIGGRGEGISIHYTREEGKLKYG